MFIHSRCINTLFKCFLAWHYWNTMLLPPTAGTELSTICSLQRQRRHSPNQSQATPQEILLRWWTDGVQKRLANLWIYYHQLLCLRPKLDIQLTLHTATRTANMRKTSAIYKKICMDCRSYLIHAWCPLSTGKSSFSNQTLLFQYLLNCITYFNFYCRHFHPLLYRMLMPVVNIWQSWENMSLPFNGTWPSLTLALAKNPLFDLGISFWQIVISSMEMKFRFTLGLMIKSRK